MQGSATATVLPSVWPPINHLLNAVYAPFKRPVLSIMQLHPAKAPTGTQNSPKSPLLSSRRPLFPLFFSLRAPSLPLFSLSPALSPSRPSLSTAPRRNAHKRKKRPKAAPSPPLPALNSTKFNLASFKIRPRLNASLNRIKPKLNPIQPFAHFVLSSVLPSHSRNSLIFMPVQLLLLISLSQILVQINVSLHQILVQINVISINTSAIKT